MDIRITRSGDADVASGDALIDDIDISTGDLVLIDGIQAIGQDILIRLRTFLGEWFLDQRVGLPWFQQILVKTPDSSTVRAILVQAITTTKGVDRLDDLRLDFDSADRSLSVFFVAAITGSTEPLVFDEELIINV